MQYIYGKNVVLQHIELNKKIYELWISDNATALQQIVQKKKIPFKRLSRKEMDKLANFGQHQGIIAKVDEYKLYSIDELIKPNGLIIALDGIEDPHNLGAILRSCDASGVDGVIITKNRSVSLNSTVAKVSVGAIDNVKVAQVTNLNQTLHYLKKQGYWIVGSSVQNARDYRTIDVSVPLVIVVGNEGKGISPLILKQCDYTVHIPMVGKVESLNVSVSAALLMYMIYQLRYPL